MSVRIVPGQTVALSPLVRRITQNNPGLMTGPGTNTYLIGRDSLFILDPGEDRKDHLSAILNAVGTTPVVGVAPTHAHPDHWPLAPRLARALGAPTLGFKPHNGYVPDVTVANGERLHGAGWELEALHTPGHLSDHLAYFLLEERALFSGDHVMGWSTSVIARPDGSLTSYLTSLDRVRNLDPTILYPAHGEAIERPRERVEELRAHRLLRSRQILGAVASGCSTLEAIVATVYADVDRRLHGAAEQSVLAHLDALVEEGRIVIVSPDAGGLGSRYALAE